MTQETGDVVTTVPGADREYYDQISFWNYFDHVARQLNRRSTGDENVVWYEMLLARGPRFRRALILNCGSGWVERALLQIGLVESAVGIDISDASLEEARREAAALGLAAEYHRVDINVDPLPDGPFDFVLNYAAAHHIAALDRVMREVAARMPADGLFVNWDYVGPHRNQFTARQWEAAWEVNETLPEHLRQNMVYPHMETMLYGDPTEAVHSELIVSTIGRYFDIDEYRPLGGAIGYLLLTHNLPFYSLPLDDVLPSVVSVMEADQAFLEAHPDDTLFAFFTARPKRDSPSDDQLAAWEAEERDREQRAARNGGEYYPRTMLSRISAALLQSAVPPPEPPAAPPAATPTFRAAAANRWPKLAQRIRALRGQG